jgi:FG-GAP repeat protein
MWSSISAWSTRACEFRPGGGGGNPSVERVPGRGPAGLALALLAALSAGADGQTLLWEAYGTVPQDGFGMWIARAGDVTGDGAQDLLVPVPWATVNGLSSAGLFRVYSGADGALVYTVTDNPPVQYGLFGATVAGLGDVNGDGLSEFLARGASITVYSGADASPLLVLPGPLAGGLGGLGDVDGDGIPDFGFKVPAAPMFYAVEAHSGATGALISTAYESFQGNAGSWIAGVGDVDGDGLLDFAVANPAEIVQGRVDVYTALTGQPILPILGTFGNCGIALSAAGDVNGDGLSEVLVGQGGGGFDNYCNTNARVVGWPSGPDLMVIGWLSTCDMTGWAVDGGFDLDGDGFDDPMVGSRRHGAFVPPNGWLGAVRIFSGQSGAVLLQVTGWPGATPINNSVSTLGNSVAYLGDVTGDDFPDFAGGADWVAGNNCGPSACAGGIRVYSGAPDGVSTFGAGCPGSSGEVARIGATWEPSVGSTWSVNLSKTIPGVPALLLLGFSNSQWGGVFLPFDLGLLGMPGCPLLVSPDLVFPATTSGNPAAGGRAKVTFAIPANPALAGATVYVQWHVADLTAATPGGAVTRGLAVTLQP